MLPAILLSTAISKVAGIDFSSGSPRYENGPLISSVQQRLGLLKSGDASAIANTHQDAATGGAGWKDVALVLAPAVRPDLFGSPARALTDQEKQITGLAPGNPAIAPPGTQTVAQSIASAFGLGPANTQAAASAAGNAAGSQLSHGLVEFGIIIAAAILLVVVAKRFLK